jgi:hypothetical protein
MNNCVLVDLQQLGLRYGIKSDKRSRVLNGYFNRDFPQPIWSDPQSGKLYWAFAHVLTYEHEHGIHHLRERSSKRAQVSP